MTIFGEVTASRAGYEGRGIGRFYPLDAELNTTDFLAGHADTIFAERDANLADAREARRQRRAAARLAAACIPTFHE